VGGSIMARRTGLFVTRDDAERLEALIQTGLERNWRDRENLRALQQELERATIVEGDAIDPDVVTMHSTVQVVDMGDGSESEFTLVYPEERDIVYGGVSVLAPLGAAVLGRRVGDTIRFRTPGGQRTIRIKAVTFQPEASG